MFQFFGHKACGTPSSLTREQTHTPHIGRKCHSHWTTREVPQLHIWPLHGVVYLHLKLDMANMELFFSLQNLFVPSLLCHLSSVPVNIMDSTKTKTPPLTLLSLFLPADQVLWFYLQNRSRIHLILSLSTEITLSRGKSPSHNAHHLPTGSTASTLATLPAAVRGNFVRCVSCGGMPLLKAHT